MTGVRGGQSSPVAGPTSLIVLNNDAIVCEDCFEPPVLEVDAGLIPWACTTAGQCSRCGAELAMS
jgi:hypothetical protein